MLSILNKEQPNPVGEVKQVAAIEEQLKTLTTGWDEEISQYKPSQWWKPWTWGPKVKLYKVTNFLLGALDELVNIVDEHLDTGPDKKATVLDAVDRLYEYVIKEALPIWLKPFAGQVKEYIIYTLISTSIDWMVDKYRNGAWRDRIKPA